MGRGVGRAKRLQGPGSRVAGVKAVLQGVTGCREAGREQTAGGTNGGGYLPPRSRFPAAAAWGPILRQTFP